MIQLGIGPLVGSISLLYAANVKEAKYFQRRAEGGRGNDFNSGIDFFTKICETFYTSIVIKFTVLGY